jgi:hypothetical protein
MLVKIDDTIVVRQLTSREMVHWLDNRGLFKDPAAALAELQRAADPCQQLHDCDAMPGVSDRHTRPA